MKSLHYKKLSKKLVSTLGVDTICRLDTYGHQYYLKGVDKDYLDVNLSGTQLTITVARDVKEVQFVTQNFMKAYEFSQILSDTDYVDLSSFESLDDLRDALYEADNQIVYQELKEIEKLAKSSQELLALNEQLASINEKLSEQVKRYVNRQPKNTTGVRKSLTVSKLLKDNDIRVPYSSYGTFCKEVKKEKCGFDYYKRFLVTHGCEEKLLSIARSYLQKPSEPKDELDVGEEVF